MSAAWLWARADLRARWRSWVVLGLLAGVTIGLAAAGVAGARRTSEVIPRYEAAAPRIDAAVLANDPAFDADARRKVAALPEVAATYPFMVPFALEVEQPKNLDAALLPETPGSLAAFADVVVDGRAPNPRRADEAVVNQNVERKYGLGIGSTLVVRQRGNDADVALVPSDVETAADPRFEARLRVVGISKATSEDTDWTPSSGFYAAHEDQLLGITNMFVRLRHGESDFAAFQRGVERVTGKPTNVERASDLLGINKVKTVTDLEEQGLLFFALAVLVGGGALVGQALVRAVSAGGAELSTWRAIGADRKVMIGGLVFPAAVTALVGVATALLVALALSPRFPIGVARRYELDIGIHADWLVLVLAVLALATGVFLTAWAAAEWQRAHGEVESSARSSTTAWAARLGLPPAMLVGTRLALEPGRGRRAVPVRSALFGAVVGVLGVVACFTFRAGLEDTVASPSRSGIVWNYALVSVDGPIPRDDLQKVTRARDVHDALDAVWLRALPIDGTGTPTFGTRPLKGDIPFVVLHGRAPLGVHEIALAPATMRDLGLAVGDDVRLGGGAGTPARVVGEALLPPTSHTDYDQGAWMSSGGLDRLLPPASQLAPEDLWDLVLVKWKPGAHLHAAQAAIAEIGSGRYSPLPATLPSAVAELGRLRSLPMVLGIFFALLAAATVMHALVTTVRRRRRDLAVLRSVGFTRRQSRLAIAWQATLFAVLGVVIGVPLGIVAGRVLWRLLADDFPVVYVAPLALAAVVLIVPVAIAVANALAALPARAAVRIRPAEALRVE
ncbi:MAG TPA: FtsX-like permease family protein [Acidimicrobiia bacterium]